MTLSSIPHPLVQDVSTTEALQGGLATTQRTLTQKQSERVQKFIAAHVKPDTGVAAQLSKGESPTHPHAVAGAQVSAEEQQQAVLARGGRTSFKRTTKTGTQSKFQLLYQTIFTSDDVFFQRDLQAEVSAVRRRSKSLVDIATKLSPQEKTLRRYLLLEHALSGVDVTLPETEQADVRVALNKLIASHGEYIAGTIGAYEVGKAKRLQGPGLREFIKGYQFLDEQSGMISAVGLHPLYKSIKPILIAEKKAIQKLTDMQKGFVEVLVREKTQRPSRATSPRHHLMLTKIKQLGLLIAVHQDHASFLAWAKKSMRNLPDEIELTELSLQLVSTKETLPAVNTLVRFASAVESDQLPARNAFAANYRRWLLEGKNMQSLFVNPEHQVSVIKQINQNMAAGAILSISASRGSA
ncbi:MAG TPA: hypothetical protein VFV39_01920 [Limnobacter sp.]|nr:hypothetical protein [Limnobacter sp.]